MQSQHDVQPQVVRSCVSACQARLEKCQHVCNDNCRTCEKKAVATTRQHYKAYIHERCVEGKTFIRRLQSYHDPLQCRKTSCDCKADYRVCAESCRGKIHKRIEVEKSCC